MNGNKLFLDTNIMLYLLNGKQLFISVITELELLAYKGITPKEESVIQEFVSQCKTISINSEVKQESIRIRKIQHQTPRQYNYSNGFIFRFTLNYF
jgi:predicted nucleic acid-binding protein